MSITLTTNKTDTTVNFSYTALTTKINTTLLDAAKYLYIQGLRAGIDLGEEKTENDLTSNQAKIILDSFIKKTILDCARSYNQDCHEKVLSKTIDTDNQDKYL